MTDSNAVGCGWLKFKYDEELNEKNVQLAVRGQFSNLSSVDYTHNAKVRILSFDIECVSENGFPDANNQDDLIITIGCCLQEGFTGGYNNIVL